MIWTEIFRGTGFSLETNFGTTPYLRELSLLRVTFRNVIGGDSNINIYYPEINQTMSYDKTRVVIIDITDYVRAYPHPSNPITVSYSNETVAVRWRATYFANINNEVIPRLNVLIDSGLRMLPPTYMLDNIFGISSAFEMYSEVYLYIATEDEIFEFNEGFATFDAIGGFSLYGDFRGFVIYKTKPLLCNRQYALVQWQSRFGNTKRATWEVAEVKNSATDVVELVNIYGGWKSRKGSEVSVVLRLRDLTPYDYWYYCDIITSNDVRVALNEIDKDLDDSTIVDVVTKSATIPNSGTKTLEVEIRYRKYDSPI